MNGMLLLKLLLGIQVCRHFTSALQTTGVELHNSTFLLDSKPVSPNQQNPPDLPSNHEGNGHKRKNLRPNPRQRAQLWRIMNATGDQDHISQSQNENHGTGENVLHSSTTTLLPNITKSENNPAEPDEIMAAFGEAFSSDSIPQAVLNEMESFRQHREESLKLRLTQLSRILQLEEEEANLPVRFSKMIRLGLHSFEELDRFEEGEREAETREN